MARTRIIEFAKAALNDCADICLWYSDQQVPEVGKRLGREVVARIERLAGFPESGRIVPEFGLANLREIIYPRFRIVYRLEERRIGIIRVWRSERLLKLPESLI